MHCAYVNPGKRPAAKIAVEQAKVHSKTEINTILWTNHLNFDHLFSDCCSKQVRYLFRGYDHPFTLNETKDFLFKLRENWVIQSGENIQYPYVFKQFTNAPSGVLNVHPYPRIPSPPHFGGHH